MNRTQFARYLTGDAIPRADILFAVAQACGLPMDWFFEDDPTPGNLRSEYAVASGFRSLVAGRRFQLPESLLSDGFYRMWKGTFGNLQKSELLLSQIKIRNGVGSIRTPVVNMPPDRRKAFGIDGPAVVCEGMVISSADGVMLFFSDSGANYVGTAFLRDRSPGRGRALVARRLIGTMSRNAGAYEGDSRSIVPIVLERIEGGTAEVLRAARQRSFYPNEDLPEAVQRDFAQLEVPPFVYRD